MTPRGQRRKVALLIFVRIYIAKKEKFFICKSKRCKSWHNEIVCPVWGTFPDNKNFSISVQVVGRCWSTVSTVFIVSKLLIFMSKNIIIACRMNRLHYGQNFEKS